MSLSSTGRACLASLFLILPLAGQTNVGQISGKVFDATGAVVPGAAVSVSNQGTGLEVEAQTDASGFYSFPSLARGAYNVRVSKAGFRSSEQTGVVLEAASRRALDFTLELGQVAEAISVSAAAIQVQSSSGDVSTVVTERQLSQIALNGRNYTQMLRLIPGAVSTSTNPFGLNLSTTGQAINGIRTNSIYFMVDGADNMDNGGNSNAIVNPNVDTISEVRILTSSYSAEFGGRSGAMVNVVTKTGTRDFHGSAFEFIRNDIFDARSFFAAQKAKLRFNNFGWTLGGPFYIPGRFNTDKQKVFFFAGQEWKLNRQGTTQTSTVPSAGEREGNFQGSQLAAPVDPANNQPFANRTVPASRWSKNGPLLLKPYPLPNFTGAGGNYVVNGVSRTDTRQDLGRVDWLLSSKTQLMYRWTHDSWDIFDAFQGTNLGNIPGGRPRPGWTTVLSWNQTINPTTLNYSSFSVSANHIQGQPRNDIMKRSTLGLTYPEIFPPNQYQVGPSVSIAGFTGYNPGDRIRNLNTTFQFRDDFSRILGSHTMKFGAQITRSRKDQNNSGANENGSVTFNTSARNTTRNVIADVLLGNFQNYTEGQVDTSYFARYNQWEFYAQDTWRVSRRLTLELGMRFNIVQPLYSALGNFTTFDPTRFNPAAAPRVSSADGTLQTAGDPLNGIVIFGSGFPDAAKGRIPAAGDPSLSRLFVGLPRGGVDTDHDDWGPRIGFSFDPMGNGKAAIRGGFGIFYDRIRTDFLGSSANNPPFATSANLFDGNIDNPLGGQTRALPPPNLSGISLNLHTPDVMSFNIGYQREIRNGMVAEAGFVSTLARHMIRTLNINQLREGTRLSAPNSNINVNALRPYLGYGNINLQETGDNSNYKSLQVSLNQRFNHGLSFGVAYTFSKTYDTSSGTPQDVYNARADYGLSSIHRAHILNVNYIWELPVFRNVQTRWVKVALAGWEVAGVTSYQSGAPNTVTVQADVARIGASSTRASVVGDPNLPRDERTLTRWFNTEAFLASDKMVQGKFGNSARNLLIGPSFTQSDVALLKNFRPAERLGVQFRAESFNILNHASFTGINTTVRFDAQGRPAQNYGAVTGSGPGRILSFGLKLLF